MTRSATARTGEGLRDARRFVGEGEQVPHLPEALLELVEGPEDDGVAAGVDDLDMQLWSSSSRCVRVCPVDKVSQGGGGNAGRDDKVVGDWRRHAGQFLLSFDIGRPDSGHTILVQTPTEHIGLFDEDGCLEDLKAWGRAGQNGPRN